jgi:hypothetical protein
MSNDEYVSKSDLELDSNSDLDSDLDSALDLDLDSELELKIERLTVKVDEILNILKKDVSINTKKMSDHVDFIENIYENVKSPLGFLCNTITHYIGSTKYTLHTKIDYFKKLK